ncbi:MAG: histidine ammonia-lyase [Fimbriimonadaceae bacterium]|nr:histidine ammonia-lyase [Fimbriimonadaceae bacterium]QYK56608.1 MAG: histidine ammonia-lyase [Fimbriimonadaceae bacterium]
MNEVTGREVTLDELARVAEGGVGPVLDPSAHERMQRSRALVEGIVGKGDPCYGVNTGFGKLSDVRVPDDQLKQLQVNLVRSHACGVGEPLSPEETRAMILLRANVLALGFSGARPLVAEKLLALLRADVLPVVPSRGSVGASGDLAPLAHLALGLIGEGECCLRGSRMPAPEALAAAGLTPLELEAKEGLALLNGTQAMGAVGGLALHRAWRVARAADVACSMTLEALLGTPAAFDPRIHEGRRAPGQIEVAAHLRHLLRESEIRESHRTGDPRVQDAYSLRCAPQVHGACRDALRFATTVVERETAAATDNPLVFTDDNPEVVSGGNFHGAPLAHAFDFAAIAITDLASITERRVERLVNPDLSEGLPPFLSKDAGTSSGMMIPQVVMVALLNEAKTLAHPASIDNLPTSAGKEDHVSMGMGAALKLKRIVELCELMVAIELMCAAVGLDHRRPLKPGIGADQAFERVRAIVPPLEADRSTTADIEGLAALVRRGGFEGL